MKLIIKKGFFNNPLIAFVFIFPFYNVNGLDKAGIREGLICIEALFLCLLFMLKKRKWKNFRITVWGIFFSLVLFLSTYINGKEYLFFAVFYGVRLCTFFGILEMYLSEKSLVVFKVMEKYTFLLLTTNLLFQIAKQDYWGYTISGNFKNFFVADNELPFYIIPYICILFFLKYSKEKYYSVYKLGLRIIILYLNLLWAWCASGIIAVSICIILLILTGKNKWNRIFQFKWIISGMAIVYYLLIFNGKIYHWLDSITVKIFNKSVSGSRTRVWKAALGNITEKMFLGYGTVNGGRMSINYVGRAHWYSHNFVLELLIQGGLMLFFLYIIVLLMIGVNFGRDKNTLIKKQWLCVFIGLHLAFLTEGTITSPMQYLILLMAFHINEFEIEKRRKLENV